MIRGWIAGCCSLALASGCCTRPWAAYPMATPPDRQCHMGVAHGHELYIWDCVGGQHVVIGRYTAELTCAAPVKEVSACGELTPLERYYREEEARHPCPPMPEGASWPGG